MIRKQTSTEKTKQVHDDDKMNNDNTDNKNNNEKSIENY